MADGCSATVEAVQRSVSALFAASVRLKKAGDEAARAELLLDLRQHAGEIVAAVDSWEVRRSDNDSSRSSAKRERKRGAEDPDQLAKRVPMAEERPRGASDGPHLTETCFSQLRIPGSLQRALREVFGYERMTPVQSAAIPLILEGGDALVRARTGTGKTLAFLVPSLSGVVDLGSPPTGPLLLIVSPTRELASQIAAEAAKLCSSTRLRVVSLLGGTNINAERKSLLHGETAAAVVVGTPGRLLDHLQNDERVRGLFGGVVTQVLDEADRLLDMGFRPDVERILGIVADQRRTHPTPKPLQSLLFSATVGEEVRDVARSMLRPGFSFVDTVGDEEPQTHAHVEQQVLVWPLDSHLQALAGVVEERMRLPRAKGIVFFPTARQTEHAAAVFAAAGLKVVEMHSRKSQAQRNRASESFRQGAGTVMFSSDVSARGMDYPGVTFVVQVGLTDRAQYIHRLGRTARAGGEGQGLLILSPFEESAMLRELGAEIFRNRIDHESISQKSELMSQVEQIFRSIHDDDKLSSTAKSASIAWLGFYNSNLRRLGWNKTDLVRVATTYSKSVGLEEFPPILKKTIGKMGLKGTPGLRVE